ncbi:hypothetical protein M0802_001445 [Mischocyttarus mexicanus]|nr:hypothetical protein M0802_001445 [Mischocyttarus mexicanus]
MDILPSGNIFRELQDIQDTGYFSAQPSLEDHWQQAVLFGKGRTTVISANALNEDVYTKPNLVGLSRVESTSTLKQPRYAVRLGCCVASGISGSRYFEIPVETSDFLRALTLAPAAMPWAGHGMHGGAQHQQQKQQKQQQHQQPWHRRRIIHTLMNSLVPSHLFPYFLSLETLACTLL